MDKVLLRLCCLIFLMITVGGCSYFRERTEMNTEEVEFDSRLWKSKKKTRIIIDPGHGGEDFGTYSNTTPRYHEKYLTIATARLLRDQLKKMGYSAYLTRETDAFVSLPKRVQFANQKQGTLFVSIHYNSAPSSQAHGVEVFYYRSVADPARSEASQMLAQTIIDGIEQNTHANLRGIKDGNFLVIRNSYVPAVLVEGGFLTNHQELQKLTQPAYLQRVAQGIAQGIDEYLKKESSEVSST